MSRSEGVSGRQEGAPGKAARKPQSPPHIRIRNPHLKPLPQEHPLQQPLSQLRDRIDIRNHSTDQQEQRAASPGNCIYRTNAPGN